MRHHPCACSETQTSNQRWYCFICTLTNINLLSLKSSSLTPEQILIKKSAPHMHWHRRPWWRQHVSFTSAVHFSSADMCYNHEVVSRLLETLRHSKGNSWNPKQILRESFKSLSLKGNFLLVSESFNKFYTCGDLGNLSQSEIFYYDILQKVLKLQLKCVSLFAHTSITVNVLEFSPSSPVSYHCPNNIQVGGLAMLTCP